MKSLFTVATLSAMALVLHPVSSAVAKEKVANPAATPAAEMKKAVADAVKPPKPLPMHTRADAVNAGAKTFTMTRADGVAVKHVVTATTEIKNGDAAAKFEDIKVGDYVNGLRNKKSDTEYEVVKITSIKPAPPAKTAEAPKEAKKEMMKKAAKKE